MTPSCFSHKGLEPQLSIIYFLSSKQLISCLNLDDNFNIYSLHTSPTIFIQLPLIFLSLFWVREWVFSLGFSLPPCPACKLLPASRRQFLGLCHISLVHLWFQSQLYCTLPWELRFPLTVSHLQLLHESLCFVPQDIPRSCISLCIS